MQARRPDAAFTLIELLAVITIIGILAALTMTTLIQFRKGDATLSATRQMLDDVARARQLAISQRTTVYMVFVPQNFWAEAPYNYGNRTHISHQDRVAASNLLEMQLTGYNFVTLRSLGDQPGQHRPRYLGDWKSLPESAFIARDKFYNATGIRPANEFYQIARQGGGFFYIYGFNWATNIAFPLADTLPDPTSTIDFPNLPYIAFNYLGQLTTMELSPQPTTREVCIPLAHGTVSPARDMNKKLIMTNPSAGGAADVQEAPPSNSANAYNVIVIDALTGRARLEHQEMVP